MVYNNSTSNEYDPFLAGASDPFSNSGASNTAWTNGNQVKNRSRTNSYNLQQPPTSQTHASFSPNSVESAAYKAAAIPDYSNEPPLLEELGINFDHIYAKTLAVLIPTKKPLLEVVNDADMAGPLVFALCLGFVLLLRAKFNFGYIFGYGLCSSFGMYLVLNLMCQQKSIDFAIVCSILGYCLLPVVLLATIALVVDFRGTFGLILGAIGILWCTITATRFFEAVLDMKESRYLIAYPTFLLYCCFTLIAVF